MKFGIARMNFPEVDYIDLYYQSMQVDQTVPIEETFFLV